ncbi:MAG: AraC family transcriptional regulator [Bacteroidota bacterium]
MFKIYHKYQSTLGNIKLSQALTYSEYEGKTTGIAMKYVQAGQENYLIGEKMLEVEQGHWMLVRNEVSYKTFSEKHAKKINGICIDLNTHLLMQKEDSFEHCDLLFNLPFPCGRATLSNDELDYFEPLFQQKQSDKQNQVILEKLFSRVTEFASTIQSLQLYLLHNTKNLETQKHLLISLLRAKNHIHEYYFEPLKLDILARKIGLSKYHFHRLFKLCFQQSPKELQIELRMQKAKQLLASSDVPIHFVAHQLGYNDTAAFSNQFKIHFQLTPSKYRAKSWFGN